MSDEVEKIDGIIKEVKGREYFFKVFGFFSIGLGLGSAALDLVVFRPIELETFLPDLSFFALGLLNLYLGNRYRKVRQRGENVRAEMNFVEDLKQSERDEALLSRELTRRFGPNIPIVRVVHPRRRN